MKLHRMSLEAIGPFAARQEIDFEALGAGGMFLLEGPTGVGKTTVLEAITFALFGHGPRGEAEPVRLHSHFAAADQRPSVELDFSVGGRRYQIQRTPRHERAKRRGTGTTPVTATVLLQRRVAGTEQAWVALSHNHEEVGGIIGELLGLSREQFAQVVALPQGRFAQFLHSDDDSRRVLLSHIFGTELYDTITAAIGERAKDARAQLALSQERIAAELAAAYEAGDIRVGEDGRPIGAAWAVEDHRGAMDHLADHRAALGSRHAEAVRSRAAAERRVGRLDRTAQSAAGTAARLARLVAANEALAHLEGRRAVRDEQLARLVAARAAAPVGVLLDELDAARERSLMTAQLLARAESAASTAMADCGQPSPGSSAGLQDARIPAARLAAVRADVAAQASELAAAVAAEAGIPALQARVSDLTQREQRVAAELADLIEQATSFTELTGQVKAVLSQVRPVAASAELLVAEEAHWQHRAAGAQLVTAIGQQLGAAKSAMAAAVDAHQARVDAHQELQDRRIAGMSAELAAALVPGQPCSVCGASEHPRPAAPVESVTARMCQVAAAARDRAQRERSEAEGVVARLREALAAASAQAAGADAEQAQQALAATAAQLVRARAAQAVVIDLSRYSEDCAARRDGLAARCDQLACELAAAHSLAVELNRTLTADRALAAAGRGQHATVAQRSAGLASALAAIDNLLAARRDDQVASEQTERLAELVARELHASGLADEQQARAALLAQPAQDELDAAVCRWDREHQMLLGQAGAPDLAGLDPLDLEQAQKAAQASADDLIRAQESAAAQRVAQEALATRVSRFDIRLDSLTRVVAEHDELAAGSEQVMLLDRMVRGQDPRKRMTLTTYVLRHWFVEVLDAANKRLAVMSGGKYQLLRVESAESSRDRVGLGLAVLDQHTGRQRSARSLSGGETFYTSLALALGLSDVVSAQAGGVSLETLFIDEGFGSLDQETLDEVMGVIDELRGNGRVVGVVSHVPELKDRIPERLEVRRVRPDGPSQVRVVA